MFNIFGSLKRIVGIRKKDPIPNPLPDQKAKILNKIHQFSGFLGSKFKEGVEEVGVIRSKMKDLSKTNYDLGLKHLKNGNISEATFRFKMIKKFWPNNYDAYYQLAYCFILSNKLEKAEEVTRELLDKKPDYDQNKIADLLEAIENIRDGNSQNLPPQDIEINKQNNKDSNN